MEPQTRQSRAAAYFRSLQDTICFALAKLDGQGEFGEDKPHTSVGAGEAG